VRPLSKKRQLLFVTVAVPITAPLRSTSTTSPVFRAAEIEPMSTGSASLVVPPSATAPRPGSTLSCTRTICTACVTVEVMTVKRRLFEAAPALPAMSMTLAS